MFFDPAKVNICKQNVSKKLPLSLIKHFCNFYNNKKYV